MLKKTFLGVLFAVFVSGLLIAGINFNVTKAVDYGSSGTSVGGIIWENTTWTLENSPYIITDTVQIPANVTLTIEPGVTVTGSGNMFLVHGRIYAHGTIDDKITFTGGTPLFNVDGSGPDAFVDLDYCTIKNGGSFWWDGHGHFNLTRSELTNLVSYSYVWYPGKDVYIEYNKFVNTAGFSIGILLPTSTSDIMFSKETKVSL